MKPFFSVYISRLKELVIICALGVTTFSIPTMANPIRDLQDEVAKRGISPEEVNRAMKSRFPKSDFPYHAPVNGCSTDIYDIRIPVQWNNAFREPCNNHDRCYTTLGNSKRVCDDNFLVEMSRICESAAFVFDTVCQTAGAIPYYKFVDEFGKKHYDAAQNKQSSYIRDVYDWLSTLKVITFQTNRYISTNISVKTGDRIRIRATGRIKFGLFAKSGGPNGIIFNPIYNYFADVPHGRLMARFRQPEMQALDGWYPIGEGWDQVREVTLPSTGILEFLVNDNQPSDNRGMFLIEVTIHPDNK